MSTKTQWMPASVRPTREDANPAGYLVFRKDTGLHFIASYSAYQLCEWLPLADDPPCRRKPSIWHPMSEGAGGKERCFTDGHVIWEGSSSATHWAYDSDVLAACPLPTEPTPEEKEEAAFKTWWSKPDGYDDVKDVARRAWMARAKIVPIMLALMLMTSCRTLPDGRKVYDGPRLTFTLGFNGISGGISIAGGDPAPPQVVVNKVVGQPVTVEAK